MFEPSDTPRSQVFYFSRRQTEKRFFVKIFRNCAEDPNRGQWKALGKVPHKGQILPPIASISIGTRICTKGFFKGD